MNGASILRGQLTQTHDMLEQAVGDLEPELLRQPGADGRLQPIGVIYAHIVLAEDWFVNEKLRGGVSLFERDGWEQKLGFTPPDYAALSGDWSGFLRDANFGALRQFAQAVYAASDDYLGGLSDADLDAKTEFGPLGELAVGSFLGNIMVWHAIEHCGEICALKGALGRQGLPF